MSGDVQPRKRKDKKRRRDDAEPVPIQSSHVPLLKNTPNEDVNIHVHKESTTGGGFCAKFVFFILFSALAVLIGLIITEHRGITDLEALEAESKYSQIFEGWIDSKNDDHEDVHDVHDAIYAHDEDDEHDDDAEDHGDEEQDLVEDEHIESEENASDVEEDDDEEVEEEPVSSDEIAVDVSQEEDDDEIENDVEESEEKDVDEDEENEDAGSISVEASEEPSQEEDEQDDNKVDKSDEEKDISQEGNYVDDESPEKDDELQEDDEDDQKLGKTDSDEEHDDDVDKDGENGNEDVSEENGSAEQKLDKDEEEAVPRTEHQKQIPKTVSREENVVEDTEGSTQDNAGMAVKVGVGVALLVVAHLVLVKKWRTAPSQVSTEDSKEPLPDMTRRNTIVIPPTYQEVEPDIEQDEEDYSEEDISEDEAEIHEKSAKSRYQELRSTYSRSLTPENEIDNRETKDIEDDYDENVDDDDEDEEMSEEEEEAAVEEEDQDESENEEYDEDEEEELLKRLEAKYGKLKSVTVSKEAAEEYNSNKQSDDITGYKNVIVTNKDDIKIKDEIDEAQKHIDKE